MVMKRLEECVDRKPQSDLHICDHHSRFHSLLPGYLGVEVLGLLPGIPQVTARTIDSEQVYSTFDEYGCPTKPARASVV
jgi:hypothetical protein